MREHNSEDCIVCKEFGTWATTPDTNEWLTAHEKAYNRIHSGIPVVKDPASPSSLSFMHDGIETGRLDWSSGELKFSGCVHGSTLVFFEFLKKCVDAYMSEKSRS